VEKNSKKHIKKYNQLIQEWKSQGCKKCGETRAHIIDAHHVDPEIKNFMVGTAARGIKITKEELKKCIPLCSNCHRDFHFLEKKTGISIKEFVSSVLENYEDAKTTNI
jgi:predicted HNH restriction endonuclease